MNAKCVYNNGSYVCQCTNGYTGDGKTSCSGNINYLVNSMPKDFWAMANIKYRSIKFHNFCVNHKEPSIQEGEFGKTNNEIFGLKN